MSLSDGMAWEKDFGMAHYDCNGCGNQLNNCTCPSELEETSASKPMYPDYVYEHTIGRVWTITFKQLMEIYEVIKTDNHALNQGIWDRMKVWWNDRQHR